MKQTTTLDVWSDVACPWCWIGKRNLELTLTAWKEPVTVRWRAFELNPNAPTEAAEPVDYSKRLAEKYGTDRDEAKGFITKMVDAGESKGLDLRFDRIRPSNTFNAHRLLAWAGESGRQEELAEILFRAYLHEGKSLNDEVTLAACAQAAGLDEDDARALLRTEDYGTNVREDQELAQQLGATGVPFFVVGASVAVAGAQPPRVLLKALEQATTTDDD